MDERTVWSWIFAFIGGVAAMWFFGWVLTQYWGLVGVLPVVRMLLIVLAGVIIVALGKVLLKDNEPLFSKENALKLAAVVGILIAIQLIPGTTPAALTIVRP